MMRRPSLPLLGAGMVCLLLSGLAFYARHAVLSPGAFADRATSTLAQDEVRDEVSERIARRDVAQRPALAAQRPLLESAIGDVVSEPAFPAEFRAGALALHRSLFADDRALAGLRLPGTGRDLRMALAARSPAAAAELPPGDPDLMTLGGGRLETTLRDAAPWGRRLAALAPAGLLAALVLLGLALWRALTLRRGLRGAALALAVAGGATVAAASIARALVLSTFDTSHGDAVVSTIWSAYLDDLRVWSLVAGAVGLVLAAAAEPGRRGAWRRLAARAAAPHGAGGRLARAGLLLVLAALLIAAPQVPLELALVAAAGLLVFTAAAEVVRLATP